MVTNLRKCISHTFFVNASLFYSPDSLLKHLHVLGPVRIWFSFWGFQDSAKEFPKETYILIDCHGLG